MNKMAIAVLLCSIFTVPAYAANVDTPFPSAHSVAGQLDRLKAWIESLDLTPKVTHLSVNCDDGGSLSKAISKISDGGTIDVSGTCNEQIEIQNRRNLTIAGSPSATIDGTGVTPGQFGGLVEVASSQDITLEHLTITNSASQGLFAGHASVVLQDVNANRNTGSGMSASANAYLYVENSNANGNGVSGIASGNSTLYFNGSADDTVSNQVCGVSLDSSQMVVYGGATVKTGGNENCGLNATDNSSVRLATGTQLSADFEQVTGVRVCSGSSLVINGTVRAGDAGQDLIGLDGCQASIYLNGTLDLSAAINSMILDASTFIDAPQATLTVGGGNPAIAVRDNSSLEIDSDYRTSEPSNPVTISQNWTAISASTGSHIIIGKPVSLTGNNVGILLDNGSLSLADGASITGNNTDVSASFGSHVRLLPPPPNSGIPQSTIGTLKCTDTTVLTQGISCPSP